MAAPKSLELASDEWSMVFMCIDASMEGMRRSRGKTTRPEFKAIYDRDMETAKKVRSKLWVYCHEQKA